MNDPTWTTRPSGLQLFVELQDTIARLQRIELLTKLERAKKQLEAERAAAEMDRRG